MGLLTSSSRQAEKLGKLLDKYHIPLCIICYFSGMIWLLLLSHHDFNAGNYFSENALLTGVVENEFSSYYSPKKLASELKKECKKIKTEEGTVIPSDFIYNKLNEIGLDAYIQNFSFSYPLETETEQHPRTVFTGKNVYGILRAPRSASFESFVLMSPWRSDDDSTENSVAILIKMADMMRHKSYWAKDIVFLFVEHDSVGTQAWLDAFHDTSTSDFIKPSLLNVRTGIIQAALNFEILSHSFSSLNFILEGINGQMPNLDLFNALSHLCKQRNIKITIQGRPDYRYGSNQYLHTLGTLAKAVWAQASGTAVAAHSPFLKFGIPALTVQSAGRRSSKSNIMDIGYVIEGISRSLNNLLERFHQSFFFYLLPNTDRYISIGLYMPPLGIMAAPVLLRALVLWIRAKNGVFAHIVPPIVLAAIMGLLSLFSPYHLVKVAFAIRMPSPEALAWGTLALHIAALLLPTLLSRRAKQGKGDYWDPNLLQSVSLMIFAISASTICVLNASLGFIILFFSVPSFLISYPTKNRFLHILKVLILMFSSPLSILMINALLHSIMFNKDTSMQKLWSHYQEYITMAFVSSHWFGSWNWKVVVGVFFPIWVLFWSCLNSSIANEKPDETRSNETNDADTKSK